MDDSRIAFENYKTYKNVVESKKNHKFNPDIWHQNNKLKRGQLVF